MRQPIVTVLGHVDSGKTSILDNIRGTGIQKKEVGGITQHIGASFLPNKTIKKICGSLYEKLNKNNNKFPGILLIDTPGHEVFTNLRTRGGSAADIAILVVDVNCGFQQQTIESIKILENRKVPFVVALNKIDMITGWKKTTAKSITQAIENQDRYTKTILEEQTYAIIGSLSQLGYRSELFNRVKDFTKEISIVPVSARFGIGLPELVLMLMGLAQQYLRKKLSYKGKNTRGIVIEINNEDGLGPTANVILIEGTIKKNDLIVAAKNDSVIITKLKTILLPKSLDEMHDPSDKFKHVNEVTAAAGIKISSQDLDNVLPGSTIYAAKTELDANELKKLLEAELKSVFIKTDTTGVIIKCDTIGSLEALTEMLKKENIPISTANIGAVNKRDVMEAKAIKENDRNLGTILSFNVKILADAKIESENNNIKIFHDKIIYSLIDNYIKWIKTNITNEDEKLFEEIKPLSKFTFLKGYVFRKSNPAIFGIRIDVGTLLQKSSIINKNGKKIGIIHQLQNNGKNVEYIKSGQEAACSIHGVLIGRQISEGDIFYTLPSSYEAKQLLQKFIHKLSDDEIKILNEIVEIKRKKDPAYGY